MSKIYEALLRAEIDRVARLNGAGQHETLPLADAEEQGQEQSSRPRVQEWSVKPNRLNEDQPRQEGQPQAEHFTSLIPGVIRTWTPDEKRLPTLQSRGPAVEQFRVLRSRISEMRLDRKMKTILISSALPEEGKSFVAANLAIGLAKFRNKRVLLIDGDMRRGTQHLLLGTTKEPGLTEFLSGKARLEEVMQHCEPSESLTLKSLASLTFISAGHDSENAADLSGNGNFQNLLNASYDKFDWIIVDSSPVTLVSDGTNLARCCDGVLFVARGGSTRYEVAQRALHELKAAHVLGVVLNAADVAPQVAGYYGYGG